jgi:hypothetical protein
MPNFTEGDWIAVGHESRSIDQDTGQGRSPPVYEIQVSGKPWDSVAHFVGNESDARLMAQSKKMYAVIKESLEDYESNEIPECMDFNWPNKMKTILSEIDKE